MRKIITIQHTQSEQHINKMIGSWADWELTAEGIAQAENIGKKLSGEINGSEYLLYSSDLRRAKHTAEIIAKHLDLKPIFTENLREFNLGEAIGQSKKWARDNQKCRVYPGTVDWAQSVYDRPFEKAETKVEVCERISEFLNDIISSTDKNIIIVAHDGTLSILFALWIGLDIEQLNRISFFGKTAGVSFLSEDENGNRIISRLNDMSYIC